MVADDGRGVQRSYIASEEIYQALREMQERNLIVPLVGDFGGPKALRSVGRYLDLHHATVSAFYTVALFSSSIAASNWRITGTATPTT